MSDEPNKTEWLNLKALEIDSSTEIKKSKFDIDNLHSEAQRRLEMLGLITTNENGDKQEATDKEIDIILNKKIQNEDPDILADKYMMQHGIYEYFKTLTAKVVLSRPADPINFMVNDLEKQSEDKPKV